MKLSQCHAVSCYRFEACRPIKLGAARPPSLTAAFTILVPGKVSRGKIGRAALVSATFGLPMPNLARCVAPIYICPPRPPHLTPEIPGSARPPVKKHCKTGKKINMAGLPGSAKRHPPLGRCAQGPRPGQPRRRGPGPMLGYPTAANTSVQPPIGPRACPSARKTNAPSRTYRGAHGWQLKCLSNSGSPEHNTTEIKVSRSSAR